MLAYTLSRHVSPTNLRFSFGSCRFRCIIFVLLLTCLAAFALTLLVCLFACRRKRNDRTRRGPMQRGATLPLPSRWPSTKGCSNTCGQPHWAPPGAILDDALIVSSRLSCINATDFRNAIGIWKVRARPTPRAQRDTTGTQRHSRRDGRQTPRAHSDTAGEGADRHSDTASGPKRAAPVQPHRVGTQSSSESRSRFEIAIKTAYLHI